MRARNKTTSSTHNKCRLQSILPINTLQRNSKKKQKKHQTKRMLTLLHEQMPMKRHQRLLLCPTHHPKGASRKKMQEIYKEACAPIFQDMPHTKKLTIACHRPKKNQRSANAKKNQNVPRRRKQCRILCKIHTIRKLHNRDKLKISKRRRHKKWNYKPTKRDSKNQQTHRTN